MQNSQLATLYLQYLTLAKLDGTTNLSSFYSLVYLARSENCIEKFQLEKKVCNNHFNLTNESKHQLKKVFCKKNILQNSFFAEYQADCMIKNFEKYQWTSSILVKLQASSNETFRLKRMKHFHRHILNWYNNDLEQLFCSNQWLLLNK